jgi:hypothetical protein
MHPLRLLGWGLLAASFVAAGAEMAAQGVTHDWGTMAAAEVLSVLTPEFFDALRDGIDEMLHPLVWDYAVLPILALPGWLLIGMPGVALVWYFREIGDPTEGNLDAYPQATYEEIVAAAHEADEQDIGIPSKYRDLAEYDPTNLPAEEGAPDPALDPLYLEQADVVPPARHIPSNTSGGETDGGGKGGGSGLNRPF